MLTGRSVSDNRFVPVIDGVAANEKLLLIASTEVTH